MDMLKLAITFLIPCNATAYRWQNCVTVCYMWLLKHHLQALSAYILEVVAEETVEEGQIGVIGGRLTLLSLLELGP